MESEFHLQSRYFGIQSARYPATALMSNQVAVPLGGEVRIHDLSDLRLIRKFKVSDDTIMVLLPCKNDLVCMSYCGIVALYSCEGSKKAETRTTQRTVRHGAVSGDGEYVCACGEFGTPNGTVDVWSVHSSGFTPIYHLRGNYRFCEFSLSNSLFSLRETVLDVDVSSPYLKDQPIPPSQSTLDFPAEASQSPVDIEAQRASRRENRKNLYYACLFDMQSEGSAKSVLLPTVSYVISCKNNGEGLVALMYVNRSLVVMRIETLEVVLQVELVGAGAIISMNFSQNRVYFSPANRLLTSIRVDMQYPAMVDVIAPILPGIETVKTNCECLSKGLYYLQWVEPHRSLFVCEETGIFLCDFPNYPNTASATHIRRTGHNTTCCGVGVNKAGTLVCSADFLGQVFVWSLTSDDNDPISKFNIVSATQFVPVRSLVWDPSDSYVLVGTMMGSIYKIMTPWIQDSQPEEIIPGEHTIVCMGWCGDKLAIGNTRGELKIYSIHTSEITLILSMLAHEPSSEPHDSKFGSLTLFSEIWTLAWSPNNDNRLATGSEDQTVVIWDLDRAQSLITLPKHRNAVTGVAWKKIAPIDVGESQLDEMLVSCSDDQQLRLYDPRNWTLLHTFRTTFICEWHTLTYLSLEEFGTRVAVVSQNGYFFLYDIPTKSCLFGEKVHSGSVEGLVWTGEYAATVSSDCSVSVVHMERSVGGKKWPKI